jgi:hypothetical protein
MAEFQSQPMPLNSVPEPLWFEKPAVLLDTRYLKNFVWLPEMKYSSRFNAVVRFALYFTIIVYVVTRRETVLWLFLGLLGLLYVLHFQNRVQLESVLGASADDFRSRPEQIGAGFSESENPDLPNEQKDSSGSGANAGKIHAGSSGDLSDTSTLIEPDESLYVIQEPVSDVAYRAEGRPFPQTPCQAAEQWKSVYGQGAPLAGYSNRNTDPDVIVDPMTNQICKKSTPENPFGNPMPADSVVKDATPMCDPSAQKELIDYNFNQGLFSNIDDVFGRNNSQRQYVTENSTTIPNDRESFMKWAWATPSILSCKSGDLDMCFKSGY